LVQHASYGLHVVNIIGKNKNKWKPLKQLMCSMPSTNLWADKKQCDFASKAITTCLTWSINHSKQYDKLKTCSILDQQITGIKKGHPWKEHTHIATWISHRNIDRNLKHVSDYHQKGRKQRKHNFINKLLASNAIAGKFKCIGKNREISK
jgi:hypothetical protein